MHTDCSLYLCPEAVPSHLLSANQKQALSPSLHELRAVRKREREREMKMSEKKEKKELCVAQQWQILK